MKFYNYYYYYVGLSLLFHTSFTSGGLLRRSWRPFDGMDASMQQRAGMCDETEHPLQRLEEGCPCFSLDTIMGQMTDLQPGNCYFYEDSYDPCYTSTGFSANWNEQQDFGTEPTPSSDTFVGFSVDRNCDDYGDYGGYVFVRNDWFENEEGVIRIDLGEDGGVLAFVPPHLLRGGEFDWNEVWPVFADVAGNPQDPSKWNSTVSFRAEERTFTFEPYPVLRPSQYDDDSGLNTFDVNDYVAGSLECGEDFDTDNDRFYIFLNGELLDSCPKSIVENYTFEPSDIGDVNNEYPPRQQMQCHASIGRSKGTNAMVDGYFMQSSWESHNYDINFVATEDEYEDCINVLASLKDQLPFDCDISN